MTKRPIGGELPPIDPNKLEAIVSITVLAGGDQLRGSLDVRVKMTGPYAEREVAIGEALREPTVRIVEAIARALDLEVATFDVSGDGPPPTVSGGPIGRA